jgi:hypothetical protein
MANAAYLEKLKDPRWQKLSAQVKDDAGWACAYCDAKDKTLTVHHSYYEWGLEPWEYPAESLHCLCEQCHEKYQAIYKAIKRQLGRIGLPETEELLGFALGLEAREFPETGIKVDSYEIASGVGANWLLDANDVLRYTEAGPGNGVVNGHSLEAIAEAERAEPERQVGRLLREKGWTGDDIEALAGLISRAPAFDRIAISEVFFLFRHFHSRLSLIDHYKRQVFALVNGFRLRERRDSVAAGEFNG